MGVNWNHVLAMEGFGFFDGPSRSFLDIGSSNLYGANALSVEDFLRRRSVKDDISALAKSLAERSVFSATTGGSNEVFFGELIETLGAGYQSVDIAEGYKTKILDLNFQPLPQEMTGAFDVVLNFGTTEHLINQMNAFAAIHDAAKTGAVIWHQLPNSGFLTHGYFTYTGRFFFDLADANGYELMHIWLEGPAGPENPYEIMREFSGRFKAAKDILSLIGQREQETRIDNASIPVVSINVLYRKKSEAKFRPPVELMTSVGSLAEWRALGENGAPPRRRGGDRYRIFDLFNKIRRRLKR